MKHSQAKLMVSHADRVIFDSICVDHCNIYISKSKIAFNDAGLFNQVLNWFRIKGRSLDDKFVLWLKTRYLVPDNQPLTDEIITQWENVIFAASKPSLYGHMLRLHRAGGVIEFYMVQDGIQLARIGSVDYSGLYSEIARRLQYNEHVDKFCSLHNIEHPLHKNKSVIEKEIKDAYLAKLIPVVENISVLRNKKDAPCLAYYDLKCGDVTAKTPAWDSFMCQFLTDEMAECFMAWVYSVFVGDNYGRQICWIYGKGNTGKSAIGTAIYDRLAAINQDICTTLEKYDSIDKHSTSTYVNKRFTLSADSVNYAIVRMPIVKNLTGNDPTAIRGMGEAKKTMQIYSKVMATSNKKPWVDLDKSEELSRLLYFELDDAKCSAAREKWDFNKFGNWNSLLLEEIDNFIAKCEPHYRKWLSEDGKNLKIYTGMNNLLDDAAYHLFLSLKGWWAQMLIKTDIDSDIILVDEIFDDLRRFLGATINKYDARQKLGSSISMLINKLGGELEDLTVARKKFIRGFKFIEPDIKKRPTLKTLINKELQEIRDNATCKK